MTNVPAFFTSKSVTDAINQIRPVFKGVPHLPKGLVGFLAAIAPWLAGLGGVLGVFSGLNMLSMGLGISSNVWYELAGFDSEYFLVSGVLQLASAAVLLWAFKPLKARQKAGWILMFWSMAISILQNLALVILLGNFATNSLLGTVIGLAIGLYILFEVEGEYK